MNQREESPAQPLTPRQMTRAVQILARDGLIEGFQGFRLPQRRVVPLVERCGCGRQVSNGRPGCKACMEMPEIERLGRWLSRRIPDRQSLERLLKAEPTPERSKAVFDAVRPYLSFPLTDFEPPVSQPSPEPGVS